MKPFLLAAFGCVSLPENVRPALDAAPCDRLVQKAAAPGFETGKLIRVAHD